MQADGHTIIVGPSWDKKRINLYASCQAWRQSRVSVQLTDDAARKLRDMLDAALEERKQSRVLHRTTATTKGRSA